jgi:hypothetical protein
MADSPVKLMIAVAIAATLVTPFVGAISGSTGVVATTDNVTADPGTYQEIDGYEIDSATFTAEQSGTTLSEGTDYNLNETAGTIEFIDSTNVDPGDTVDLSYEYQATDGTTTTITDLLPLFVALLVLVTLAAGVMRRM